MLSKWNHDLSNLLNANSVVNIGENTDNVENILDANFDLDIPDIDKAVENAKIGKAAGIDLIPSDVLKNDASLLVFNSLFNVCFKTVRMP